jgi:hypothetical protein
MGQKISEKQMKEEIRSVVRENIKEVTTNDWHYKAIMSIWDKGGSFTRKKIGAVLCNDPKANRRDVEDALRNSGYDEVTDVTDRLRIEGVITEGGDQIPGGLAKGMTLNDIAQKHGMSVDMLVAEFKKGIQTEMEHTTDREMAKEITMDHLFEDPQYYTKLATVEEYVDDKGVEHVAAALPQTEEEPIKEEEESEETLRGLKEMAMGDLERIADYANMILERMGEGQNLDSWMYSQITLAVDQLNSVHDTMDGKDGVKESVNEYNVNKKFGSKYDIGAGSMGSGTIFWNRAEEEFGDYKKIAHVSDSGKITFYDKKLPSFVKKHVEDYAKTQNESINELSGNERQIKNGNPNNIFYIFYKGQFAAEYWAMNPHDLYKIYWDKFKVRKAASSQFKLNPEFIIVPKKEYDNSTSNRYAKLKPYVDEFWDKLQTESINEGKYYVGYNKGRGQGTGVFKDVFSTYKDAKKEVEKIEKQRGGSYNQIAYYVADKDGKFVRESVNENLDNYSKDAITDMIINLSRYEGNEKLIADLKKILKQRSLGKLKKEQSVNEGSESNIIAQIKDIAKNHQNNTLVDPKTGKKMRVDAFSASAIATVYDALSDSNKEKFLQSGLLGMQQMAMKLLKK